jgi:alanine racemase
MSQKMILFRFWSEELPINEFSNKNGLISYELMTRISSRVEVKVT